MTSIGERLKTAREKLGLTQAQLAEALEVKHKNTISTWERGLHFPSADVLLLIREKFGISVEWLVAGEGMMRVGEKAEEKAQCPPCVSTVNLEVLTEIIGAVEEGLEMLRLTLKPDKKAELIAIYYEELYEKKKKPDKRSILRWLRLLS